MMVGGISVGVGVVASIFLVLRMRPVMSTPSSVSSQGEDHVIISSILLMGNSNRSTFQGHVARPRPRLRVKRSSGEFTNRDVESFNDEEKRILVNAHNVYRAQQGSSDMMYMYWDQEVADFAQAYAERCNFEHSPDAMRKNFGSYAFLGENLYAHTGTYDPAYVIKLWYDEITDYNYNTLACSNVCGHYTQVVWANSFTVGCGVAYCSSLSGTGFPRGFLVSCNYGPGGNYRGRPPFKKGPACSACESQNYECVDNMCAKYPVIGNVAPSRGPSVFVLIGCAVVSAILSWLAM